MFIVKLFISSLMINYFFDYMSIHMHVLLCSQVQIHFLLHLDKVLSASVCECLCVCVCVCVCVCACVCV